MEVIRVLVCFFQARQGPYRKSVASPFVSPLNAVTKKGVSADAIFLAGTSPLESRSALRDNDAFVSLVTVD